MWKCSYHGDHYTWYWYENDPEEEEVIPKHRHSFPDTGLRKSWCSCGAEAKFNPETFSYELINATEHISSTDKEDVEPDRGL